MGHQVLRALVVSGLAGGLDVLLLILLVKLVGWPPYLAASLTYLVGGVIQYLFCACWVFPSSPARSLMGVMAFLALSLVGVMITVGGMWLCVAQWRWHYLYAKGLMMVLTFGWNFATRKYLLFHPGTCPTPVSAGGEGARSA